MKSNDRFDRNQLLALATVALLSPALRLIPGRSSSYAGQAAWLAPLAALPALLPYVYFLCRLMACRRDGEGLGELALRCLGEKAGKPMLALFAAWFLLYGGFILRSGADRLITTIYPHSGPALFILVMGLICLIAALGPARSLARVAKLVLPIVLSVLAFTLFFGQVSVDWANLLPVTYHDAGPLALGALTVMDVISVVLYTACFLCGLVPRAAGSFKAYSIWLGLMCLGLTVMSVAVVGSFGPELTARMAHPFFSLVRNLVFFNSLERVEALVVTLWIFPDFLLGGMLLFCAQLCLRRVLGQDPHYHGEGIKDMGRGRWLIPVCGAVSIAAGLFTGRQPQALGLWSDAIIPLINLSFAFILVPLIFLIGKLRKSL